MTPRERERERERARVIRIRSAYRGPNDPGKLTSRIMPMNAFTLACVVGGFRTRISPGAFPTLCTCSNDFVLHPCSPPPSLWLVFLVCSLTICAGPWVSFLRWPTLCTTRSHVLFTFNRISMGHEREREDG